MLSYFNLWRPETIRLGGGKPFQIRLHGRRHYTRNATETEYVDFLAGMGTADQQGSMFSNHDISISLSSKVEPGEFADINHVRFSTSELLDERDVSEFTDAFKFNQKQVIQNYIKKILYKIREPLPLDDVSLELAEPDWSGNYEQRVMKWDGTYKIYEPLKMPLLREQEPSAQLSRFTVLILSLTFLQLTNIERKPF